MATFFLKGWMRVLYRSLRSRMWSYIDSMYTVRPFWRDLSRLICKGID